MDRGISLSPDLSFVGSRYLLVNCTWSGEDANAPSADPVPFVKLDPRHPLTMSMKAIQIPDPNFRLENLLIARKLEFLEDDNDEDDNKIFAGEDLRLVPEMPSTEHQHAQMKVSEPEEEKDPWVHDPDWVEQCLPYLLEPPSDAMPMATMALQKELRACLREQEAAKSLKQLGWYMPPEYIGDNLFQWIVELHSFEEELPITKDLKTR